MPRELYGLAEIAETLGLTRQAVTVWRKRRSWDMPEPDVELASGPVWHSDTIEPWLQTQRSRLSGGDDAPSAWAADVRRAARRLLRLLVLQLEEPARPNLIRQALQDVEDLHRHLANSTDDRRARLLALLEPAARLNSPEDQDELTRALIRTLPDLADILAAVQSTGERAAQ
ncbi:hypothetical protein [Actinomadura fibrosa]|uniref:Uncharacterized protein n=1 Tax=Actinomadura fibrosa TaxID=111802 RepID=A0ABW2XDM8_9ACTN|nr:hypothetical protein [Actinomadura fibrosa]